MSVVPLSPKVVGNGLKLSAEKVLRGAGAAGLDSLVVVGFEPDGTMYVASTDGGADTVYTLEAAKLWISQGCPIG